MALLEVKDLCVYFRAKDTMGHSAELRAVDGVSFAIKEGESLGLVGESGCGKTTVGNAIIGLVPVSDGKIVFDGDDVVSFKKDELKKFKSRTQMVFQDPFGSLNPRMSIGSCLSEVLKVHGLAKSKADINARVEELLKDVGLEAEYANRYPHEFSGGQRQRIGIARALAVSPSLIIADEPVSALDVSVQVQILNLMKELQEKKRLSYLFVAHDLTVVKYMCERILVMYLGKIVESASSEELFKNPSHPYTEALLSAIPDVDKGLRSRKEGSDRIVLVGDVPSPTERIPGCPFHQRCHRAKDICKTDVPPLKTVADDHISVCHFAAKF